MQYFIIEHDKRPDGIINASETARSSYSSALSYYHERYSKMAVTDLFTSVALMLVDDDLNIIERAVVQTLYKEPETTEEPSETVSE